MFLCLEEEMSWVPSPQALKGPTHTHKGGCKVPVRVAGRDSKSHQVSSFLFFVIFVLLCFFVFVFYFLLELRTEPGQNFMLARQELYLSLGWGDGSVVESTSRGPLSSIPSNHLVPHNHL